VTTNAIGDLAKKEKWDEGSWQKTALHGMAGAIEAAVAKGNIGVGALAGVTNEQLLPVMEKFLESQGITEDKKPEEFKALMKAGSELAGMAVGALASGGDVQTTTMAGSIAVTATENNRLLHPKEIVRLQKLAPEFAKKLSAELGRSVTDAEALILLSDAAYANVDKQAQDYASNYLVGQSAGVLNTISYIEAKKFLASDSQTAGSWVDDRGVSQKYFAAQPGSSDFYNPTMYSQYTSSQAYRDFSYSVLGINFPPTSKTDTVGWSIYNKNEAERLKQGATTFAEGLAITAIAAITERAVGVGVNYVQIKKTTSYLKNGEAAAMTSSVDGELAEATLERQKVRADKAKNASEDLKVCNGTACFIAGTMLHTSNGLKAIETLVNGELVWARDENTLEYGFRPIVATKATPNQALYEVVVGNSDGGQEAFYTTAEHPFWVDGEGWRKASLLEAGMKLLGPQNEPLEVVSQTATGGTDTVFNIQVHEFSTYHVGALGVWVHNDECCVVKSNAGNKPYSGDPQSPDFVGPLPNTPTRFVNGVVVVDQRTGQVYTGTVDLQPTIDRINNGIQYPHRNDGSVFKNNPPVGGNGQSLLPVQPPGYYTEYVVPTPGVNGPGPQRIVVGGNGEMYYTPDHYGTFIPIKH
jgi:filamentous hemagglutinin